MGGRPGMSWEGTPGCALFGAGIARTLPVRPERSSPMDRTIEIIRADWRAAIDEREDVTFKPDLEARIERLRVEHVAAFEARRSEIQDTWARRSRAR